MKFLRLPEVRQAVGMSRSQIYRMIQSGQFPKPVKLGTRMAVWPDEAIEKWQASKLTEVSKSS